MAELRTNAGLVNTLTTLRPLLSAKATRHADIPKEDAHTHLLDTQMFSDPGAAHTHRVLRNYVTAALQDGNAVLFAPWITDARTITTLEHPPPGPPDEPPEATLLRYLGAKWPDGVDVLASDGNQYDCRVTRPDGTTADLTVRAYQDDRGRPQYELTREETLFDGPLVQDLPIESVLMPTHCENLQPASAWNPTGAPYVGIAWTYRLTEVLRLQETGEFNALDAAGVETLRAAHRPPADADPDAALQSQKDRLAGQPGEPPEIPAATPAEGHLPIGVWRVFDQWDLGDGMEDVYWVVAQDAPVLLAAYRLRDLYPAVRAYRPFGECCPIPVPGQYYGISLLELGEALYDQIKGTLDQAYDGHTIARLGFFFYNANAKFQTTTLRVAPLEGVPVPGDPRANVFFPTIPAGDQGFAVQTVALAFQWFDRLMSIGPIQAGQVPIGRASALRTVGTTQALLQQGDVRADQLLVALFDGLRQCAQWIHAQNRHHLTTTKVVRKIGWAGERETPYLEIGPDDLDAAMDFEFRPDFLLASKEMRAQAIQQFLMVAGTPFAMQMGVLTPQRFTRLVKDYARALRLDPADVSEPPESSDPPILWEEALSMILQTHRPMGPPLEGAEAQLQKLQAFILSDSVALIQTDAQRSLLRNYERALHQHRRTELLTQQAASLQQALAAGQARGGAPAPTGEPPLDLNGVVDPAEAGVVGG
jgi:hypothetical protein